MIAGDIYEVCGSYRTSVETGLVTTIAADGLLFSLRYVKPATYSFGLRLRRLEAEFLLTTAFGAAQEVGYQAFVARSYTASPSAGAAYVPGANDGKKRTSHKDNPFAAGGDMRVANALAITAGTATLDGAPIARGSYYASAIGTGIARIEHDFMHDDAGILLGDNEGFVIRNTVLMGATGVGKWKFSLDYDLIVTF